MAVDIATLGLEVRSDGVVIASDRLRTLTREGGRAEAATNSLANTFGSLTRYMQAAAAAMAALSLTTYIKEATLLAARVETLGVVLRVAGNNAGYTASQMLGWAEALKKQGITTQEAYFNTTKMAQATLDMSKASALARVAQDAGVVGNINSSEAFARMIQGIRSGEAEILRNIGLQVSFEQAYKKFADANNLQAKSLTESQKMQARANAVLAEGAKINGVYEASMTTAGKMMSSFARLFEELKLAIGNMFLDKFTVGVFLLTDALKWANNNVSLITDTLSGLMTGAVIFATSKLVPFAEAMVISANHSQALRMNLAFNAAAIERAAIANVTATATQVANTAARIDGITVLYNEQRALLALATTETEIVRIDAILIDLDIQRIRLNTELTLSYGAMTAAQEAAALAAANLARANAAGALSVAGFFAAMKSGGNMLLSMVGGVYGAMAIAIGTVIYAIHKMGTAEEEYAAKKKALQDSQPYAKEQVALKELYELNEKLKKQSRMTPQQSAEDNARIESQKKINAAVAENIILEKKLADARNGIFGDWSEDLKFFGFISKSTELETKIQANKLLIVNETKDSKERLRLTQENDKLIEEQRKKDETKKSEKGKKEAEITLDSLINAQRKVEESIAAIKDAGHKTRMQKELELLAWEVEQGKKSALLGITEKAAIQKADYDRELKTAGEHAAALRLKLAKPNETIKPAGKDAPDKETLEYNKAAEEYNRAYLRVLEIQAKIDAQPQTTDILTDKLKIESKKALLSAEQALLSAQGQIHAAMKKQIELDELARKATIDATTADGKRTLELLRQGDTLKLTTAAMADRTAQFHLEQKARDTAQSKSAFNAAQTGADSSTGIITDPYANQKAVQDDLFKTQMDNFAAVENARSLDVVNTLAGTDAKKKAELDLADVREKIRQAEITGAQKSAAITTAAEDAKYNDLVSFAKKTFPKITSFQSAAALMTNKYHKEEVLNEQTGNKEMQTSTQGKIQMIAAWTGFAASALTDVANAQDQTSRQGFETAKALSMGAAVMSTAQAISNALATPPFPLGVALAVGAAAMGAVQIATIASTSFGGGGGVSAPSLPTGSFGSGGAGTTLGSSAGVGSLRGADVTGSQGSISDDALSGLANAATTASLALGDLSGAFKKFAAAFSPGGVGAYLLDRLVGLQSGQITPSGGAKVDMGEMRPRNASEDTIVAAGFNRIAVDAQNLIKKQAAALNIAYTAAPVTFGEGARMGSDRAKDEAIFNSWLAEVQDAFAAGIPGLIDYAYEGERASATAERLGSALYDTNTQFDKLGITLLKGLSGGNTASKLEQYFERSGKDLYEATDSYFTGLFTEQQQKMMEARQAQTQVTSAFVQLGMIAPTTRAEFISLVNSLNLTTDSGANTFAALMEVSEAFGIVTKEAEAVKTATEDYSNDLTARTMKLNGLNTDLFELRIKQEKETQDAITGAMDVRGLAIVQDREWADAVKTATGVVADSITKVADAAKKAVTDMVDAQLAAANAAKTIMTGPLANLSPEAAYMQAQEAFGKLQGKTDLKSIQALPAAATALLNASKGYNASGSGYQSDLDEVLTALNAASGLTGSPTTDALDAQITLLEGIKQAIADGLGPDGLLGASGTLASLLGAWNDAAKAQLAAERKSADIQTAARNANIAVSAYNSAKTNLTTIQATKTSEWTAEMQSGAMSWSTYRDATRYMDLYVIQTLKPLLDTAYGLIATARNAGATGLNYPDIYQEQWTYPNGVAPDRALPAGWDYNSYAVGTANVPYDMTANIHQGEIIMDRASSDVLRKYGIPSQGSADNKELVVELKTANKKLEQMEKRLANIETKARLVSNA